MIEAELIDTNVPAKLTVNGDTGGLSGLTVGLEVLDARTQNSYLDFNDGTFKTAGWTQKSVNVVDVGGGRYSVNGGLDLTAMTLATDKLLLEYNVSGAKSGVASEELLIRESTYQAKIGLIDDNVGLNDRYTVTFFKNSEPIIAGIATPKIQVIRLVDDVNLIASTALTLVTSLGSYIHDESTNRIENGKTYQVKATATIDGKLRTWFQQVGRDS